MSQQPDTSETKTQGLPPVDNTSSNQTTTDETAFKSLESAIQIFKLSIDAFSNSLAESHKINERDIKLRRWKFFAMVALFMGVLFLDPVKQFFTDNLLLQGDYVNVVEINGEITDGKEASPDAVIPLLEQAFNDKNSKGVVIDINSPGGTPVASSAIRNKIISLREAHPDKKVIAIGADFLTSGAYMIATASEHIYSNTSSIVGSIGVIIRTFGFHKLAEKYDVERRIITSGENKAGMDSFTKLSDSDRKKIEHNLAFIHEDFIAMVKESRGDKLNLSYRDIFSGQYWTGKESLEIGLIDGVGYKTDLIKEHFDTINIKTFRPGRDIWSVVSQPAKALLGVSSVTENTIQPMLLPH